MGFMVASRYVALLFAFRHKDLGQALAVQRRDLDSSFTSPGLFCLLAQGQFTLHQSLLGTVRPTPLALVGWVGLLGFPVPWEAAFINSY